MNKQYHDIYCLQKAGCHLRDEVSNYGISLDLNTSNADGASLQS